ncbi:coproporphyrinogen III oxidase [Photobacterium kishitanii]|uniref:Heme chaperone HemW n=1 Tax=Photobacterium kishitanii TaxID=318456 RepID=A0AAX0YVG7_9GAMM|nr:radical SAM family heme chaperone HemW [Photobacterium kishitanii]KJG55207.1 coproporphyrinogen III oxidase [Photobacterium kishitanii]KJG57337.1 coproporphyrinogen III oxidase [Photobacterium kishitanii]KJG63561.1 coproporphyrinogen III oxidase [Photobacterium kishitanii]KJG65839.1 coproporphyrinogen III oxidase [Photobacterium kishitanii]PSX17930.1 YggW family oxidoreductase [Photobacterium kishitanii]
MLVPPPLSLYVHIPWCVQKCPYCDFNSHALKTELPELDYIDALIDDLETDLMAYQLINGQRPLHSIFIGGGTPSLISPSEIGRLLTAIEARIPFSDNIEITMEANPGTVEAGRFEGYRQAGVNRISIGIQSFQNDKLQRLGRIHGSQEAIKAIELAKSAGLNSFNTDLMHGLPDQSIADAISDLKQAIALDPPHLSWYQLTIEPNTLYYSKPPTLPDDDDLWDIFEQGHALLTAAGYQQYEISGYSKPDKQCQHNLNYWRFGDYLGIGCGAHGKISFDDGRIIRTVKVKHPRGYLQADKPYLSQQIAVADNERPFEFFMNRFRLLEACPKQDFIDRTGLPLSTIEANIDWAIEQNYLLDNGYQWQITEHGKLFLNDLLAAFVEDDE